MNRWLFWIIAFCMTLHVPCRIQAQEVPALHFTQDDGLPANTIYFIYRDSKGFLWIATDKGIARYNGIRFEKFSTFNGMPDNEIFFFREDFEGRLWLGTFNGELCYYQNGVFHTRANTPFLNVPFRSAFINNISIQYDSSITITFSDVNNLVNIKGEQCNVIKLKDVLAELGPSRIIFTRKLTATRYMLLTATESVEIETVEIETSGGDAKIVKRIPNKLDAPQCGTRWEHTFCQNQVYIYNDCSIFNDKLQKVSPIPPQAKDKFLYQIYFNSQGKFVSTSKGLLYNDSLTLMQDQRISSITQDNTGNYWLGTLDNGLYCINASFLTSRVINNAYNGKIPYAGTAKGSLFFVNDAKDVYRLTATGPSKVLDRNKKLSDFAANNSAYFIDSSARYYRCAGNKCEVIDNLLQPRSSRTYGVALNGPNALKRALVRGNDLYVHASLRVVWLDMANNQSRVLNDTEKADRVYGMAQQDNGDVWFTTVNKVFRAQEGLSQVQRQFKDLTFKNFDFFGKYMVGYTHDNQLVICDSITSNPHIDSIKGQNCIWDKLYRIDATHVLLSTNNLYRVLTLWPVKSSYYSIHTVENPFVPTQADAVCMDATKAYFFKNGKITAIDLATLLQLPSPPRLFYTTLQTRKASYVISPSMKITFHESRDMKISFNTASFGGKEITYQYSLSKTETDNWVDLAGNEINVINSGFGNYIIKIRARTISSDWSDPVVFRLDIMRPYWVTWWFILLSASAVTGVIVLLVRRRVQLTLAQKQKEHENQVRFMKSEYKALNALMNPHFIFNTLNNVQGLVNRNDKRAANEYLRVFADLVRQNMHNISKELIPLQKELDLVANYLKLEKLRFKEMLNYTISIDEDLDLTDILIPPLLVQPLVENSIKHGILPMESVEGIISVDVRRKDDMLVIDIWDNGIGIGASAKKPKTSHESFGLENIQKRIEQLGIMQNKEIRFRIEDVYNEEGVREGTLASISMAIND